MRRPSFTFRSALSLAALLLVTSPTALVAKETVTLRVNDTEAAPGEVAFVVVRTYAPRTVGQGQICLRADPEATAAAISDPAKETSSPVPWVELESFAVLSSAGDAVSEGLFDGLGQRVYLAFASLSGSINQSDGPLAVLFFRIAETAPPDTEFQISLDPVDTFLVDPEGRQIGLELRSGRLKILQPSK